MLELIQRVRDNGLPVILISHNMPHVFEIADRIHIHRLGRRVAVVDPKAHSMHEVVGIMTGAVVHDIEHRTRARRSRSRRTRRRRRPRRAGRTPERAVDVNPSIVVGGEALVDLVAGGGGG